MSNRSPMTNRIFTVVAVLTGLITVPGCGDRKSPLPPLSPSPGPPPAPSPTLIVFNDRSGFGTTDLRDVHDQIVRFNSAGELIWVADDTRLPGYRVETWNVGDDKWQSISGRICAEGCAFEVRFGMKDGEKRAYLTVDYGHDNPGTLVDVEVANRELVVNKTNVYPPGTPTLSGIVAELTPTGLVPLAGVNVYRGVTTGWRGATTDKDGLYSIPGLIVTTDKVVVSKEGYQDVSQRLTMNGDTRFDIQLVRR